MAERIPQSIAKRVVFRAYLASDHVTPATGKTIAMTISKNGGAFGNPAAGATNATEISSGYYYFDLGTGDSGTQGPLAYRGAVATVDDVGDVFEVVNATNAGFTASPNAAAGASGGLPVIGTGANNFKSDASANVTYANAAPPTAAAISTQVGTDLSATHGAGSWATATGFAVAGDAMALTGGERTSLNTVIKTTAVTESYRANGAAPTEAQFMSEVLAHLGEVSISGTTKTIKKLDHATTAETFTLDSATTPAAITRAT